MIDGMQCASCVFWDFTPEIVGRAGLRLGFCLAHAPRVFQREHDGTIITRWPVTNEFQGCGEHATVEVPADA